LTTQKTFGVIFFQSKQFILTYVCSLKKIYNVGSKVEYEDYGDITKISDKVGILLEFTESGLDITYFINKKNIGVAFKSLPPNTYYPCVVLGYDGTKVKMVNNVSFPESLHNSLIKS